MRRGRLRARTARRCGSQPRTGAVEFLVERAPRYPGFRQRGHDEAGIGALRRVLGLADDAPVAAPAVERAVAEVAEQPGRVAHLGVAAGRLGERLGQHRLRR
jgi:hypothetical protein